MGGKVYQYIRIVCERKVMNKSMMHPVLSHMITFTLRWGREKCLVGYGCLMPATCVPRYVLRGNTGLSKHGDTVTLCRGVQNLSKHKIIVCVPLV